MKNLIFSFTWRLSRHTELRMKELHFPDCLRQRQQALTDPSASLFKQGLGTYRKALRDKHTPLLITSLFIFKHPPPSRRHSKIYSNRTPYGSLSPINQITPSVVVVVRDTTSMFQQTFVSSAITTMRQTAWQRCGDETTR